jgi:periplasmic protein TonB
MKSFRAIAIALSLMIHASLGYAMLPNSNVANILDIYEAGTGDASIVVEKGIAIEGLSKLGDGLDTIQTADVTPVDQQTPPAQEIKPVDEIRDVITATDSKVEEKIVKTEELKPEPPKPDVVQAVEQPQQVAMVTEKSSSEEKIGKQNLAARSAYEGQVLSAQLKARVDRNFRKLGKVKVAVTIGLRGEVLSCQIASSSGSPELDERAVAALKEINFPPIPPEVAITPLSYTLVFNFRPH